MENPKDICVVTCALTGVLTDPRQFPVPVTPAEMATAARQAFDAGASIVHCHFRQQEVGQQHLPSWDPDIVEAICQAIRREVPEVIINMSTGIIGPDVSGPAACLERVKPDMAALNAGSLNYLKLRKDGSWAWPPLLFDNPVEKIERLLQVMQKNHVVPECECFDTGIVRSVAMFQGHGLLQVPIHLSLVMGVASGMPARPQLLDLLLDEMTPETCWQVIAIGRQEVWPLHRRAAELGGHLRTGLEDTFYLPDGTRATSNGQLVEALVRIAEQLGRKIASPAEARAFLHGEKNS